MLKSAIQAIQKRLTLGLTTWPDRRTWLTSGGVFLAYVALAWGIGFGTGLYRFEPQLDVDLLRVAIIAFFVPAICEEVFFRGVLIPNQTQKAKALPHTLQAIGVFLAWHPFNAWLFFPEVLPLFSDWRFLSVTACLGLACSYLWRRTGSLWPPVLVHWVAVLVWKAFLGAPRMM